MKAKACASSASPFQPTSSTERTGQDNALRSPCMITGLRRPPPHTSHSRAGLGNVRTASAADHTVKATSVAAPSAALNPLRAASANALKCWRSSDFGAGSEKYESDLSFASAALDGWPL